MIALKRGQNDEIVKASLLPIYCSRANTGEMVKSLLSFETKGYSHQKTKRNTTFSLHKKKIKIFSGSFQINLIF